MEVEGEAASSKTTSTDTSTTTTLEAVTMETTAAVSTAPTPISSPTLLLPDLLRTFQDQLQRISTMEERIAARTIQARRRLSTRFVSDFHTASVVAGMGNDTRSMTLGLESDSLAATSNVRQSHLRLYVAHSYTPEVTAAGAMAMLMQKQVDNAIPMHSKPSPPVWTLLIEGKLLVDQLDSGSLKVVSNAVAGSRGDGSTTGTATTILVDPNETTGSKTATTDDANAHDTGLKAPPKLKFTHLFEKVSVTFQTVFVWDNPKTAGAAAAPSPSKKKSRRSSTTTTDNASHGGSNAATSAASSSTAASSGKAHKSSAKQQHANEEERRQLSTKHVLVWNVKETEDAHLWSFAYPEPTKPPPEKGHPWKVQSVVAHIQLYRRHRFPNQGVGAGQPQYSPHLQKTTPTVNPRYRICSVDLQAALFPHHGPMTTDLLTGIQRAPPSAAGAATTSGSTSSLAAAAGVVDANAIPSHNQVHVPNTLTLTEIVMAFYTYIFDRRLVLPPSDEAGGSGDGTTNTASDVVHCDTLLSNLLGMEQFSFSQLQQLLFQRNLIQLVGGGATGGTGAAGAAAHANHEEPIDITYILEQDAAVAPLEARPRMPTLAGTAAAAAAATGKTRTSAATANESAGSDDPSILQVDIDIAVPSFYSYRIHSILGRNQRRIMEYTQCRSLARARLASIVPSTSGGSGQNNAQSAGAGGGNVAAAAAALAASNTAQSRRAALSAAKDDDDRLIRAALEPCITSPEDCTADCIPLFLALAQGARPDSEARTAAQLDARITYLVGELQERLPRVFQARETRKACELLATGKAM